MSVNIYCFYNNKGGVGKTTLCTNLASNYAKKHQNKKILVIDMCPQANSSQFFLGGGEAGYNVNQKIQKTSGRKNIVGFIDWVLKGNSSFTTKPRSTYGIQISQYNENISDNLYLIAGDSFLESLSLGLNYAVLNPVNKNAWRDHMVAIRKLCHFELEQDPKRYTEMTVFIDCNPSFSIYTQMALVSSDHLILPVMADYSSLEGIKGIFMLLYGKHPSESNKKYAEDIVTFYSQVRQFNVSLPKIYEIIFNNYTANRGVAMAYDAIRNDIIQYAYQQYNDFPELFYDDGSFAESERDFVIRYVSNVKDFHTSGKVSASLGIPILSLTKKASYVMPDGDKINLPSSNYALTIDEIKHLTDRII
ncbi:cellulose biosynthesis protein BcsQ [Azospirillum fermentarium]|uniref:ParA family protein n=1 Tax=Azospirillum fermentarium TaxID=1233114 RepID=UPI0022268D5D|nr:AAA family ATPase [Azospirillum fermentarium]MCW2248315.1 cellulose biosynthesis protein BcsQ [Azospirillum fermentarium]